MLLGPFTATSDNLSRRSRFNTSVTYVLTAPSPLHNSSFILISASSPTAKRIPHVKTWIVTLENSAKRPLHPVYHLRPSQRRFGFTLHPRPRLLGGQRKISVCVCPPPVSGPVFRRRTAPSAPWRAMRRDLRQNHPRATVKMAMKVRYPVGIHALEIFENSNNRLPWAASSCSPCWVDPPHHPRFLNFGLVVHQLLTAPTINRHPEG